MVGLSVVLEGSYKGKNKKGPQVINKYSKMIKPSSSSSSSSSSSNNPPIFSGKKSSDFARFAATNDFLQRCFLCKQKLLAGKDIYMYKGDKAFCSKECRCRQILMDEEEETLNNANATAVRFSLMAAPNCHNNGSANRASSSAFSYNI